MSEPPDPARIVADADVLAADLFLDGAARDALDVIRAHSWLDLVATAPLLDDAAAVITTLANASLATTWRDRIEQEVTMVEPTLRGQPALVAAEAGGAATVLSENERLQSAQAGVAIRGAVDTSVKSPQAFTRLLEPADLHETVVGEPYPGPDRDPRA